MLNIDIFARQQLDLIEIEKNAEIDESKALLSTSNLQRLQLKGLCLLKLKIDHKYTGLYGRTIVVLESAVPGKQIDTSHFSSGDIVSISENSIPPSQLNNENVNIPSGTVTKVTNQSVSVAVDNDLENIDDQLNESDTFKLIKLCNDVTHKRIKSALNNLKDAKLNDRTSHLADVLFLRVKPDKCNLERLNTFIDTKSLSEEFDTNAEFSIKFFNKKLDQSQQEAIKFTFEQKDLAIIHGPPGTGKTTTLVEIIKQNCLKYKQKILICAPSNIAVDNLVERLISTESNQPRIKMIRLGHPARLLENIQDYSLDSVLSKSEQYKLANDIKTDMENTLKSIRKSSTQRGEREALKREMRELRKELYQREEKALVHVLQGADCILATLTTTHPEGPLKHLKNDHFDIIIIDECSQAMEAACWIPLIKGARKLIIAGDHLQLPPTIISKEAAEKGLDLTLMKRLIDSLGNDCTKMLTTQYRMNNLINNWISDKLYDSKLKAADSVAEHLLCDLIGVEKNENTSSAIVLIDTDGCEMNEMIISNDDKLKGNNDEESKANEGEANIVCKHVHDLIKSNVKQEDIAIITPYNLQKELIKAKLSNKYPLIEVKSVDGFQGREKEAVILSLVRSNSFGEVGFLSDQRRINVAISRARRHLCVVCDSQTCRSNDFLKSFLDYCEKYADVRSGFDYENNTLITYNDDEFSFGDVKFQKLKSVVSDQANKSKHSNKSESKKLTKHKEKNDLTSNQVQIDTEEDKLFQTETIKIIENLLNNRNENEQAKLQHNFSSQLNSRQRRIVHELAEKYKINHESQGTDDSRFISISVQPSNNIENEEILKTELIDPLKEHKIEELDVLLNKTDDQEAGYKLLNDENQNQNKNIKKNKKKTKNENLTSEKKDPKAKTTATSVCLIGELDDQNDADLKYRNDCRLCSYCNKFILKVNYLMHELHCTKLNKNTNDELDLNSTSSKGAIGGPIASSKSAKNEKIKKNPIETAQTDDFDELIEMFQKSSDICSFKGCKVLVKTLGQNCEFCRIRFCLKHSLAELHGCAEEAKKQARAHIRKTGNLEVNERQSSYSQDLKHKYAQKKLHEKIEKMKAERTGADKKKEKK